MRLIQRYLFRQFLGPTIAATVALGVVALLTQFLYYLDIIVDHHQTAIVFLRIVVFSMPQLLSMVLPIAMFVAALMTLNRLHTEQEIVVCFAGGLSRWRVVSPFLRLAAFAALLTLVVTLWVAPWCQRQRQDELFRVKTDLVTTLVRDGAFTEPGKGLTVYAQSTDKAGVFHNMFIDDKREDGSSTTFNARTGEMVMRDGKPGLILHDGSNQRVSKEGALNYLTFTENVFDLSDYISSNEAVIYKASDRYLHELLKPDLSLENETRNRKKYIAEANARLASPLYDFAVVMLALAGVLGGSFSRTGYSARIGVVSAIALVVRILGLGAQAACDANVGLNVIQYLVPLVPTLIALSILFRRGRASQTVAPLSPLSPLGAT